MSYVAFGQAGLVQSDVGPLPGPIAVPYLTKNGQSGVATMGFTSNCGNVYGLQQMLKDLGYDVEVDGIPGPKTLAACGEYAIDRGIPYTPGTAPTGLFCAALEAEWMDLGSKLKVPGPTPQGPPGIPSLPSPCPPGTIFDISTLQCVPESGPPSQPPMPTLPSGKCPDGTWGVPPVCVPMPGTQPTTPTPSGPPVLPPMTPCPDNTFNNWPMCLLPPGTPPPPVPQGVPCPEGTEGTFPNCRQKAQPPKELPPATTPTPEPAKAGMSTGTKVAIGVAVAGGVGALALILTAKPKKATPNRRTSRRRRTRSAR